LLAQKKKDYPSLKKESKVTEYSSSVEAGKVVLERQYTEKDDVDQKPIPTDQ
jgi:hypothetical protein